jgi:hypothetical protein
VKHVLPISQHAAAHPSAVAACARWSPLSCCVAFTGNMSFSLSALQAAGGAGGAGGGPGLGGLEPTGPR